MKQSFYKWITLNRTEIVDPMTSSLHVNIEKEKEKEKDPLPQTELFFPIKSPIQNYEQHRVVPYVSASLSVSPFPVEHIIELPIEPSPPLSPIQLPRTTESYVSLFVHAMYKCVSSQLYWCSITLFGK